MFVQERLIALLELLVAGDPAPAPDEDNRRNGISDSAPPFGTGATIAGAIEQPTNTRRLDRASFRWQGGPEGTDRPLDRAFVIVQHRRGGHWRTADTDLGLRMLWKVEDNAYQALWEAPRSARLGRYRFKIQANGYRLRSARFRLRPARDLKAEIVDQSPGRAVVQLHYPSPVENVDLTWRPRWAQLGYVAVGTASGKTVATRGRSVGPVRLSGKRIVIHGDPGDHVAIHRGALRDRRGNRSENALSFDL